MDNLKYGILALIHGGGALYCWTLAFLRYFEGNIVGSVSWAIAGTLAALTGPSA